MGKKGVDLALIFGGHKPGDEPSGQGGDEYEGSGDGDEDMGGGDVPPDFQAAYEDYKREPSAEGMWEMIRACVESQKG